MTCTWGCLSTRFAPTQYAVNSKKDDRTTYSITCQIEREMNEAKNPIKLPRKPYKYLFRFHPYCDDESESTERLSMARPLNIVVVLDRTGSMEESINGVKTGLLEFAQNLEATRWDVKFAAIGFRDEQSDFKVVPFTSAHSLSNAMTSWEAKGGGDYQEAGMAAIVLAHSLLKDFTAVNPQRANPLNIILYASNGVAYWGKERDNFSVEALVAEAKKWQKEDEFPPRFYYSIPKDIDPAKDQGLNAPDPFTQMTQFVAESKIEAKSFSYPLSRDIFNQFTKEFFQVTKTTPLLCKISDVLLESNEKSGVASRSHLEEVFNTVNEGDPLNFSESLDPKVDSYNLKINRCCTPRNEDFDGGEKKCFTESTKTIPILFDQAKGY